MLDLLQKRAMAWATAWDLCLQRSFGVRAEVGVVRRVRRVARRSEAKMGKRMVGYFEWVSWCGCLLY